MTLEKGTPVYRGWMGKIDKFYFVEVDPQQPTEVPLWIVKDKDGIKHRMLGSSLSTSKEEIIKQEIKNTQQLIENGEKQIESLKSAIEEAKATIESLKKE
jgi:hypothetical protein